MFKFEGRTAVISGGAEGIGFAIAKALGEQKMNIVLADIDEQCLLKSVEELESLGIPVLALCWMWLMKCNGIQLPNKQKINLARYIWS